MTKSGGTDDASTFGTRRYGGEGQTAPPYWNRYVNRSCGRDGKGGGANAEGKMREKREREREKGSEKQRSARGRSDRDISV